MVAAAEVSTVLNDAAAAERCISDLTYSKLRLSSQLQDFNLASRDTIQLPSLEHEASTAT